VKQNQRVNCLGRGADEAAKPRVSLVRASVAQWSAAHVDASAVLPARGGGD
jgi:hypothetical protein